jgi:hypothetical protein
MDHSDAWIRTYNLTYKPKCRDRVVIGTHPWLRTRKEGWGAVAIRHFYRNTRGLSSVTGYTAGRVEINGRPQGNNPYTTYFTAWVRR